ncbi:uncharacterized protein LOC110203729 [Phascolarctos cinereus]
MDRFMDIRPTLGGPSGASERSAGAPVPSPLPRPDRGARHVTAPSRGSGGGGQSRSGSGPRGARACAESREGAPGRQPGERPSPRAGWATGPRSGRPPGFPALLPSPASPSSSESWGRGPAPRLESSEAAPAAAAARSGTAASRGCVRAPAWAALPLPRARLGRPVSSPPVAHAGPRAVFGVASRGRGARGGTDCTSLMINVEKRN